MTMSKKVRIQQFHEAAIEAWNRHNFRSYRDAEQKTGINYSTIYMIVSRGRIPSRGQVIEWAEGLGENINHWLELAGYDLIQPELLSDQTTNLDEVLDMWIITKHKKISPDKRKKIVETLTELIREYEEENG